MGKNKFSDALRRIKTKDWLWFAAVFVFTMCVIEGVVYYHETESSFLRVTLNIQNIIKAFKLDPDIKQVQAMEYWRTHRSFGLEDILLGALTYIYCIAVLVAPFCTVAALLTLLEGPYAYVKGKIKRISGKGSTRLLIWGQGKDCEKYLNTLSKEKNSECKKIKIDAVIKGTFSGKDRIDFMEKGIKVKRFPEGNERWRYIAKSVCQYDEILLCDDNEFVNISNYRNLKKAIDESNIKLKNAPIKVYMLCKNQVDMDVIGKTDNKSINSNVSSKSRAYESGSKSNDKPNIVCDVVNLTDKAVNNMFAKYQVYDVFKKCQNRNSDGKSNADNIIYSAKECEGTDVHLGIIGFGDFGQSTLISGLNLAVLSADSLIRVDVFDKDINTNLAHFLKRFSSKAAECVRHYAHNIYEGETVDEYVLSFPDSMYFKMDGKVEIHFWNVDAWQIHFKKMFEECAETMSFSYVVIALGEQSVIPDIITGIKNVMNPANANGNSTKKDVNHSKDKNDIDSIYPQIIAVTQDDNIDVIDGVKVFSREKEIYSHDAILNADLLENAKRFHWKYKKYSDIVYGQNRQVSTQEKKDIDSDFDKLIKNKYDFDPEWNKASSYEQESTLFQSMHQKTKKEFIIKTINNKIYDKTKVKEVLQKIEHRRWVLYMITHGWRFDNIRDNDKKLHPCICTWEELKNTKPAEMLEYDYISFDIADL